MKRMGVIAVLITTLASATATAHEAGEFIIRAGITNVEPRESSDAVLLNGKVLSLAGSRSGLGADSSSQLGLTFNYMLSPAFSLELLAATPFRHTATGTGELAGLDIAELRQLPPTLSLIYHLPSSGALQPYVGAGINYTIFFKEEVTGAANTTLATLGLSNGRVSLDSSVGASVQGGFDYHLRDNLLLNASVRWIDIDTEATIKFSGGAVLDADVEVDPFVYTLSIGRVF